MCLDFSRYQRFAETATKAKLTVTTHDARHQTHILKLARGDLWVRIQRSFPSEVVKCVKILMLIDESTYKGLNPLIESMRLLMNSKQPLINRKRLNYGFYRWGWHILIRFSKVAEAY